MATRTAVSREQPFECDICHSRFTRHENLKRHSDLHTRPRGDPSFACNLCRTTFSRRDLRDRHLKRKHPDQEHGRPAKVARRDTVISVDQARRRSPIGPPQEVRPSSASPSTGRRHVPVQEWNSDAYLDMDNASWDIQIPSDPLTMNNGHTVMRSGVPNLTSGNDLIPGEQDGALVNISDPSLSHSSYPNSSFVAFEMAPPHSPLLLSGNSRDSVCRSKAPSVGATGLSTPSPVSSCDGAISTSGLPEGLSPKDLPYLRNEWYPSADQVTRGLHLYFSHVSHFVPFLHQPTLDSTSMPAYLILSILSLAFQHGQDQNDTELQRSDDQLSLLCFHRARVLVASEEEIDSNSTHNVALVQTLLLLEICAMFYFCGKTSTHGLKLHSRMISIARSTGLMRTAPAATATTKDLDSMWREAIKAESHKRTILAAHQIDALWYQFLSVPRLLSHLEIKHELPCPEDCWTASTAADWAHRRLVASQTQPIPYTEAVRLFLSRSPDVNKISAFDPYGAINIAQFLLSSAREVSGWSTMTGQVSLERFEPLRASLEALAPFIRPPEDATVSRNAATGTATWEMAMIELNIWSPSHTAGNVVSSIDAALSHSTYHARSGELPFGSEVLALIQPHLDWFLQYLDTPNDESAMAPWLDLYAYKAFLLAWQLVRGGISGAMNAVDVLDNDISGASGWLRSALARKRPSKLRTMIIECLDVLDQ